MYFFRKIWWYIRSQHTAIALIHKVLAVFFVSSAPIAHVLSKDTECIPSFPRIIHRIARFSKNLEVLDFFGLCFKHPFILMPFDGDVFDFNPLSLSILFLRKLAGFRWPFCLSLHTISEIGNNSQSDTAPRYMGRGEHNIEVENINIYLLHFRHFLSGMFCIVSRHYLLG